MPDRVIHRELSVRIMAAAFEVHNTLGPGLAESLYEEALAIELQMRSIPFNGQKRVTIHCKHHTVGNQRLDFVVDDAVVLELKAVSALNETFEQRVPSYLKATGLKPGILINLGTARVEYSRIAN